MSEQFDYQSVCHCSKTGCAHVASDVFDYQSVCHCSKTYNDGYRIENMFDYQSVCHCSKTA